MLVICWILKAILQGPEVASYYTNEESGSITASGHPYVDSQFSCANKEVPFGTLVVFYGNGRSVMAVVTDRGPFIRGRTWDLSLACARRLGMLDCGTLDVWSVQMCLLPDSSIQSTLEQLDNGKGVIVEYAFHDSDGCADCRSCHRSCRQGFSCEANERREIVR